MTLSRRVLMSIMVLLLFMPVAWSINMGGGASVSVSSPGGVQGNFAANSNGAVSTATSTGTVVLGQTYWVQDRTGKRAEILLDVVNGKISKYRAEFRPRQGKVPSTSKVSAKQTLDISGADKITTHAKAVNAGETQLQWTSRLTGLDHTAHSSRARLILMPLQTAPLPMSMATSKETSVVQQWPAVARARREIPMEAG